MIESILYSKGKNYEFSTGNELPPLSPLRTLVFTFKSLIYIFFVHGAVLHEEFFIRVYDVY